MSLIRLLKESELIKKGPIFSLQPITSEIENLKQIILEKDVIINNNTEKIQELEVHISDLEKEILEKHQEPIKANIDEIESKHDLNILKEYSQMPEIIMNYERLITEITASYEIAKEECNVSNGHLACLECSFADLIEKYERLKCVVIGYQENQTVLLNHLEQNNNSLTMMGKKYTEFKSYAVSKLNEANLHLEKKRKKHISEMAKVKSQLLQSKVKIGDLENKITLVTKNFKSTNLINENNIQKSHYTSLNTNS